MCGKKCMRCDQIAEVCEVGTDFFLLLWEKLRVK
jgi:hypothetical protein